MQDKHWCVYACVWLLAELLSPLHHHHRVDTAEALVLICQACLSSPITGPLTLAESTLISMPGYPGRSRAIFCPVVSAAPSTQPQPRRSGGVCADSPAGSGQGQSAPSTAERDGIGAVLAGVCQVCRCGFTQTDVCLRMTNCERSLSRERVQRRTFKTQASTGPLLFYCVARIGRMDKIYYY